MMFVTELASTTIFESMILFLSTCLAIVLFLNIRNAMNSLEVGCMIAERFETSLANEQRIDNGESSETQQQLKT